MRFFSSKPRNQRIIQISRLISSPQKFFKLLSQCGLQVKELPLPDHYDFNHNPFQNRSENLILITEKDAVKCQSLAQYCDDERIWVAAISVELPETLIQMMIDILKRPSPEKIKEAHHG